MSHVGFRADWLAGTTDNWTVQGDAYDGTVGQFSPSITVIGRPGPTGDLRSTVGRAMCCREMAANIGSDIEHPGARLL